MNYKALILPEHRALLDKAVGQKVGVPIILGHGDIEDLFRLTAKDLLPGIDAAKLTTPWSLKHKAAIDPRLSRAVFSNPSKTVKSHVFVRHALPHIFALLGYAAGEGQRIDIVARTMNRDGSMNPEGGFESTVNPELFTAHEHKPLEGARLFFDSVSERLKRPERMTLVAFMSPPAFN